MGGRPQPPERSGTFAGTFENNPAGGCRMRDRIRSGVARDRERGDLLSAGAFAPQKQRGSPPAV